MYVCLIQVETYVRQASKSQAPALTVHHVSLLERDKYQRALIKRMPYLTAAYVIFWKFLDEPRSRRAAIRCECQAISHCHVRTSFSSWVIYVETGDLFLFFWSLVWPRNLGCGRVESKGPNRLVFSREQVCNIPDGWLELQLLLLASPSSCVPSLKRLLYTFQRGMTVCL
jgi:hypothetical protein